MTDKTIKVVVIDDNDCCIANLQNSLSFYTEFELVGIANNGIDGQKMLLDLRPHLVFVDVELPQMSGLELINDIQNRILWELKIVYYTAYNKYLLDALRSTAFDFLLKPYTQSEFDLIIKRYFTELNKKVKNEIANFNLGNTSEYNKMFMVSTITGYQVFKAENIVLFEYQSIRRSWIVTLFDKSTVALKRCTTAEDILNYATMFVQISQNIIINYQFLSLINDSKCVLFPPFDMLSLKISRKYFPALQHKFESI